MFYFSNVRQLLLLSMPITIFSLWIFSAQVFAKDDPVIYGKKSGQEYKLNFPSRDAKIAVRHGAAIDAIGYQAPDGDLGLAGGKSGALATFSAKGLSEIVVHEGDFRWGGRPIVKIDFIYTNGVKQSAGSLSYASNIKSHRIAVTGQVLGIDAWSAGWLLEGVRFHQFKASPVNALARLDFKYAPAIDSRPGFLYVISPQTRRVGLPTYDGQTPIWNNAADSIDLAKLKILECGPSAGFIKRDRYINHQTRFGTTGYESIDSPCRRARNLQYKWFSGEQLGTNIWYSRNENDDIQCFSFDGRNCLSADFIKLSAPEHTISQDAQIRALENNAGALRNHLNKYDEVHVVTHDGHWTRNISLPANLPWSVGKRIRLTVNSTWPVNLHYDGKQTLVRTGASVSYILLGGRWHDENANLNDDSSILISAQPLACGSHHKKVWGSTGYNHPAHWCSKLLKPTQSLYSHNIQEMVDSKQAHMNRLFQQMLDWKLLKIEKDNNYASRLSTLKATVDSKYTPMKRSCSWWLLWNPWAAIVCADMKNKYNNLKNEYNALRGERDAKIKAVHASVNAGRNMQLHKLHSQWAQNDATHFAALLKEESQTLADLKKMQAHYAKDAEAKHKQYLAAVEQYKHDTRFGEFAKNLSESLPLVGPEIRNIVNYAENPTSKNLRHMLLGIAGPVGEAVEGAVELTTGDSGFNSKELKFLNDVLTDLGQDHSIGKALEDIVSDAINTLGDEAVESIRQAGLWTDNPSDDPPFALKYQNVVGLKAQASRFEYDPWKDTKAPARLFQAKFTPKNASYMKYMSLATNYNKQSLTDMEYAAGGSAFNDQVAAIFAHSMGKDYAEVARKNAKYKLWSNTQINHELYKVVADPAYYEQRIPYWVTSEDIGQRPAGLIYTNDHAVIVFNSDLLKASDDLSKFYFEELGHMLNWWRCKIFAVPVAQCEVHGDAGARFRDAVLIDPGLHQSSFQALLTELPAHTEVDQTIVKFAGGLTGKYEGWPHYYTMNDHVASRNASFGWLMRLGLDVESKYPGVSDEFDMEANIGAPVPAMKGNPWKKAACGGGKPCYCKTDTETNCNMPTMWVSVSFRDAIKLSVTKTPKLKNNSAVKFAASKGGADISPRMVRKHGGKLPFQLKSVNGTDWEYYSNESIYFKKFTVTAEAKLDFWKMGHAISGKNVPKIHKPELSLKTNPAAASWLVEIATKDKADFAGWLAADIATAVGGCAAGFVIGIISEQDPVLMCHAISDVAEGVETAFQFLDKKPTILIEADGNVVLPASLDYKYATSGNKLTGRGLKATRVRYHKDTLDSFDPENYTVEVQDKWSKSNQWYKSNLAKVSKTTNPQITAFKNKAGKAFTKLGARSIAPIAVFRFRMSFDYAKQIIQPGEYSLPSVIVSD